MTCVSHVPLPPQAKAQRSKWTLLRQLWRPSWSTLMVTHRWRKNLWRFQRPLLGSSCSGMPWLHWNRLKCYSTGPGMKTRWSFLGCTHCTPKFRVMITVYTRFREYQLWYDVRQTRSLRTAGTAAGASNRMNSSYTSVYIMNQDHIKHMTHHLEQL